MTLIARRHFLGTAGVSLGSAALSSLLAEDGRDKPGRSPASYGGYSPT